jgi:hypothetical protein
MTIIPVKDSDAMLSRSFLKDACQTACLKFVKALPFSDSSSGT